MAELATELRRTPPAAESPQVEELWLLLTAAVGRFLRHHRRHLGPLADEDLEDLTTQKSLDLLERIDASRWEPDPTTPEVVAGYVSSCVRNAVVDHLRRESRSQELLQPDGEPQAEERLADLQSRVEDPSLEVERTAFAQALRDCVSGLRPRARTIWMLRVFYEMRSKIIADHPEVRLKPGHVDVILHDCRRKVSECMDAKGLQARDMPPGCYAALWQAFRLPSESGADGHGS